MDTETEAIVAGVAAQLDAVAAEASAEAAAQAARDAEHAARAVEREAEALAHQRHAETIAQYEHRILELEQWKATSTETLSQLTAELQAARMALALLSNPPAVVAGHEAAEIEPGPLISETSETEMTEPATLETMTAAEPPAENTAARRRRRLL
jgi:hypothetical protein